MHEPEVNDAIMRLFQNNVINLTRIADVWQAYKDPPHDWGGETAWRLFNAATYALAGKVAENTASTKALHQVIDSYCDIGDRNQLALPVG